jgi:hypothetical protein
MDNKIREVDPHTFWKWLTRDVEVGIRKGVGDAPIPLPNVRAWMNWPKGESEIIITVHDEQKDDDGLYRRCGELSFRFSAYKNKLYEINTRIGGEQFITDYYKNDLEKKIEDKWPEQPSPVIEKRGRRGWRTPEEKRQLVLEWRKAEKGNHLPLEQWLEEQCGSNPETGALKVPVRTFQGWYKNVKQKN